MPVPRWIELQLFAAVFSYMCTSYRLSVSPRLLVSTMSICLYLLLPNRTYTLINKSNINLSRAIQFTQIITAQVQVQPSTNHETVTCFNLLQSDSFLRLSYCVTHPTHACEQKQ